jgi:ferredoxin-NADP reductase/fatty acid desaturase
MTASIERQPASTPANTRELRQPVLGLPDPGERVPALARPTVALYLGTLALFALEAYGVLRVGWTPWLTVPMGAAVTFLMFSVLHEATHHAISTNTRLNNLFGHLAIPFVAGYTVFPMLQFIHIEHHRNTNEQKSVDPDAWTSEGPWWQLPFRWATIDLWYLVFYLKRIRERPLKESVPTTLMFIAVTGLFSWGVGTGHFAEIAMLYLIPQRLGMLVLAWWFDYLPHHGLTATQREDKYQATRVRVGGETLLTPLFLYQNYHLVHHLHPSVPFYRYVQAWRRNEQAYLDRNAAISTWFGRSLTPNEYRTWRRLTDQLSTPDRAAGQRPVFHPLRVASVEPLTADSVVVTFEVPADLAKEYHYVQGQHLTLRAVVDGNDVRRSYSICAPVSANTLRVAVKRIEGGVFSGYVNSTLQPGDILDVMTPTGRFHTGLAAGAQRRYAGVVAGSGITPVLSILGTTLEVEPDSTFDLVYGNRTADSTMFLAELESLASRHDGRLRLHHVRSREGDGRVDGDLVRSVITTPEKVDAWFLCGPQEMVEGVRAALGANGVASDRMHTELFHTVPEPLPEVVSDLISEVTVAVDGIERTFPLAAAGDTILDAALQAGIDAPYACAGGACGTCRAKVMLGHAVMDQNHALDEDELARGYVLTCQAHPTSEELRVDYDA